MQTGIVCPKCSYARQATDTAPAWRSVADVLMHVIEHQQIKKVATT